MADYYPFGSGYLPISLAGTNNYFGNRKEKQNDVFSASMTDWYDYGARFFDPKIGSITTPDHLAAKNIVVSICSLQ
jgi:hypothetical protein